MNAIKHLLFGHLFPWTAHAVRDAKAWISALFTVVGGAVLDSLQAGGMDITQALQWTAHQWAAYLAKIGIPAVLTFYLAGRPHQTATDIAAKLAALPPDQRAAIAVGTDVKPAA